MKRSIWLAGIAAIWALLAGCAASPILTGNQQTALTLNFGSGSDTPSNGGRFLASDNASATLVVRTPGAPDQTFNYSQITGSIQVLVSLGEHTFVLSTYNAAGNLLTTGTTTMTVDSGVNVATMSMSAAITGVSGTPITLAAGQIAYFTAPGSTYIIYSTTVTSGGPINSVFWLCAADGSFIGLGSTYNYFMPPSASTPNLIRVQNTNATPVNLTF